ncbi:MAG: GFA family protein [Puniceicoccaceae bacterium]
MSNEFTGGCYCGYIRYQIAGDIESAGLCHCENCRKAIGAQAVAWILLKKDLFSLTTGELHRYPTETKAWRGFCPKCGTSISYESPKRPDEIDITTGSLDNPDAFPPEWDAFDDEKIAWVPKAKEVK